MLAALVVYDEYWAADKKSRVHSPKLQDRRDYRKWLRATTFIPMEEVDFADDRADPLYKGQPQRLGGDDDELLENSTIIIQRLPTGRRQELAKQCLEFAREHLEEHAMSWVLVLQLLLPRSPPLLSLLSPATTSTTTTGRMDRGRAR